ncbi:MAG: cysteine desulfurase [Thiohalocapsa sp.]|jgi:cysteine desulfurase/selenocysteine lyase|uniref:aminotransferase class V-fold PLP-dependent enzyme n=1 Tax=Thiohalocapsa sp. TaxID=2497641 RepID=UPI0025CFBF1C|nr:cysteine desulfurase [Thiohalocapsa sp.]MCG6940884.1 cysteine desulfurase [Thiohalocapsa sp.]
MTPAAEISAAGASHTASPRPWDLDAIRRDFPILDQRVNGVPLAYLDNAATAQKPAAVIDAIGRFYRHDNANVHRAVHALAERATTAYEAARERVRGWINARSASEVIFLRGTTEAINLLAHSLGEGWSAADRVVLTQMEHHANIVPWQLLRERTGIEIAVLPVTEAGELDIQALPELLDRPTRLLALTHVSNVLGTINPIADIVRIAHAHDVPVLVDGAQALAHQRVDVQALDCDFYCLSGHKMFGPTGIGALYGKAEQLAALPPWQGGGEMIRRVTFERVRYAQPPQRFEAGTQDFAGAIGLAAAIDYLDTLDRDALAHHEQDLLTYATERLDAIPGLRLIGRAAHKAPLLSFLVEGVHAHDMGTLLDRKGVAVRTGHHCAMPLMDFYGVPATTRASLAFYNTRDEIDRLADAIDYARGVLA